MFEVDFLAVEPPGSAKSGDAIALRFSHNNGQIVVVIDCGYGDMGNTMADHIEKYYDASRVDLAISTHPDGDHLNGFATLLDRVAVGELWIHQPGLHFSSVADLSNLEALEKLLTKAAAYGIPVTEPFTGAEAFGGKVRVLGPTRSYYEQMLGEHLEEERRSRLGLATRATPVRASNWFTKAANLLERALSFFPAETLTDPAEDDVSGRNNSSVITLFDLEGHRLLFTGDAGVPALQQAADDYESTVGPFANTPLTFLQAPHHGSRRNLGPTLLDRILGPSSAPFADYAAFISSAKASDKHPSPKIVNALGRRGCWVVPTEGSNKSYCHDAPPRPDYGPVTPLPPLVEDDDE